MREPWFIKGLLGASGSVNSTGTIQLVKARTLSITVRATYGASIDADTTCYLYYSPDGKHRDTISFATFALDYSAGNTVQRTVVVDVPEHGYIDMTITNGSSADTMMNVLAWYSIQSWGEEEQASRGSITKDTGED